MKSISKLCVNYYYKYSHFVCIYYFRKQAASAFEYCPTNPISKRFINPVRLLTGNLLLLNKELIAPYRTKHNDNLPRYSIKTSKLKQKIHFNERNN